MLQHGKISDPDKSGITIEHRLTNDEAFSELK